MTRRVHLPIDRSKIGEHRARRVFQMCREFANTIAPGCYIMKYYIDHEHIGWYFDMPSEKEAQRLRIYHHILLPSARGDDALA
jgi:hypothetical protein